jgi:hypothetical protein
MERYSAKKRIGVNNPRRADSTVGRGKEPTEIITSTNLRDLQSNMDRSPSISPTTLRTNQGGQPIGGTLNTLFYHNEFGESSTPVGYT